MSKKVKPPRNKQGDSMPLVKHVVEGIEELKGNDITCLSLKKIPNSPCDYFVICEGNSRTHVQAIAGSVEDWVKKHNGSKPWHTEGLQNAEWILMDYVDVVVHIFQPEQRQHYGLEDMWADAEVKDWAKKIKVKKVVKQKKANTKPKKSAKTKAKKTEKAVKKNGNKSNKKKPAKQKGAKKK